MTKGTPHEEDEAEASEDAVGAAIGRPPEAKASEETVGSDALIAPVIAAGDDAAAEQRQEASGDASLPEADAAEAGNDEKTEQ